MSDSKFYVTTPIYYVNDKPHIGHAYTTILADVLARYHRLLGMPVHFLTGTDEHGQKVQQAAEKRGVAPRVHVDETVVRFLDLWKKLEITNDDFIRTTEPRHVGTVQRILQDLYDRDEIYRADYDGWYCVTCERFFTEKDLTDGKCPESGCGRTVDRIRETNYFFRMSKYQQWLIDYIQANPDFIQPDFRRNETLGFLRNPLNDLCISRPKSRLSWGIELPFDHDFVTYVWFDALVNYISAVGYGDDPDRFARWWPASLQLIGKDILTTHTVYWPTMLKAMGLPMPKTVFAHGWWLVGRDKMSKTAGNVVNPMEMVERYGVDPFRYFLMAEMSLGQDASFTEQAFVRRYNSDLANDLGNLLSRVMRIIGSSFAGSIPACGALGPDEQQLREVTLAAANEMVASVGRLRPDQGLSALAGAVREANRYVEKRQPWSLAKQGDASRETLGTVLYCAAESLRIVSGMLYPTMPGRMLELRAALGCEVGEPVISALTVWGGLRSGSVTGGMSSLFPRIEVKSVATDVATGTPAAQKPTKEPKQVSKEPNQASKAEPAVGVAQIGFDDFTKLDLRTACILTAQRIEGADKLLRLEVETIGGTRQIVAGIAKAYAPEDLIGKTIVVVANLKPAVIRGFESCGMLLAASTGEGGLRLITVDGGTAAPGLRVG
ncbi:MAG TPA: methionine--tRNA ligase [Verrucomicrobia bacterium]|nr:methionine--tRNA ligase [Verrucomicrobiota bacterium]